MFLEREDMEEYMMSTGNMIHKVCRTSIKSRAYRDDEYIWEGPEQVFHKFENTAKFIRIKIINNVCQALVSPSQNSLELTINYRSQYID